MEHADRRQSRLAVDVYITFARVISGGIALSSLLDPSQHGQFPLCGGVVIVLTLVGWDVAKVIGGVIANYFGRKRTMLIAISAIHC